MRTRKTGIKQHDITDCGAACLASVAAYSLTFVDMHYLLLLVAQAVIFVVVYIGVMKIAKVETFNYLVAELKSKLKK